MPKIVSTNAHLSKILNVIEENPEKTIGIITRTNRQIIKISQYLDSNSIKYSLRRRRKQLRKRPRMKYWAFSEA